MGLQENMLNYMQAQGGKKTKSSVPRMDNTPLVQQQQAGQVQQQQVQQAVDTQNVMNANQASQQQQQFGTQQEQMKQKRNLAIQQMDMTQRLQVGNMTNKFKNASSQMNQQLGINKDKIFTEFANNQSVVNDQYYQLNLEALASSMALSDQSYLAELQKEGTIRRLNDANGFESSMQDMVNGFSTQQMQDQFGFDMTLLDDQQAASRELASMSTEQLLALAKMDSDGAATGSIVNGMGTAASGWASSDSGKKTINSWVNDYNSTDQAVSNNPNIQPLSNTKLV